MTALLRSGFPFQTAIAELAQNVPNCGIVAEEFPWRHESGDDRFLDLLVSCFNFAVAVECKKTQKEIFTFLQPNTLLERNVKRCRCSYVSQIQDATKRLALFCGDWQLTPESPEAAFCVVSTSDSGRDQRLLERDAQLLLRGADAFGRYVMTARRPTELGEPDRIIVPVIVTNAKMFRASYNPGDVSLKTGEMPRSAPEISELRWIRFRKPFLSGGLDVGERTVFVVAAAFLQEFLRELQKYPQPPVPERRVTLASNLG